MIADKDKEFLEIPNQFSNILENSPWFYTSDMQGKTIEFGHNKLWSKKFRYLYAYYRHSYVFGKYIYEYLRIS